MADKVNVEIGGKSKYEVAEHMAWTIFSLEGKASLQGVKRQDYLQAVYQSIRVLEGISPS